MPINYLFWQSKQDLKCYHRITSVLKTVKRRVTSYYCFNRLDLYAEHYFAFSDINECLVVTRTHDDTHKLSLINLSWWQHNILYYDQSHENKCNSNPDVIEKALSMYRWCFTFINVFVWLYLCRITKANYKSCVTVEVVLEVFCAVIQTIFFRRQSGCDNMVLWRQGSHGYSSAVCSHVLSFSLCLCSHGYSLSSGGHAVPSSACCMQRVSSVREAG